MWPCLTGLWFSWLKKHSWREKVCECSVVRSNSNPQSVHHMAMGACYNFFLGLLELYLHHSHHHFPTSKHKNASHSRLSLDWSVTRKMRQEIECPNQSRLLLGSDNAETLL